MLKIFIKHCIYEKCIEILFDRITANFNTKLNSIKVGDTFYYIRVKSSPEKEVIYYSPVVVAVEPHVFVIEGVMFTEMVSDDGYIRETDGDHYRVCIRQTDSVIKCVKPKDNV